VVLLNPFFTMKHRIVVLCVVLLISFGLVIRVKAQNGSWKNVLIKNGPFYSIFQSSSGEIFAGSASGDLYCSSDEGATWKSKHTFPSAVCAMFETSTKGLICFTSANSKFGKFTHWSTDQGLTWTSATDSIDAMFFALSPQGYLFRSTDRYVWRSTDQGLMWDTFLKNPRSFITGLFFDSAGHVLISYRDGVERSNVSDSNWTDLSCRNLNMKVWSASAAMNGDIIADVVFTSSNGMAIYRNGQWNVQTHFHNWDYNYVQPFLDSSGNIFCFVGGVLQSTDYGQSFVTLEQSTDRGCEAFGFLRSRNGYLFATAECAIIRSISRIFDSSSHFPSITASSCITSKVATNLGQIRGIVSGTNKLFLSNGGIAEIFKVNGGAIGYLSSMPEAHGGPMVIQNDSFFFVNYDNDHPEKNWSKLSKIPVSGGLAQQNILLQTQKITDMKSDDTALYLFCSATSPISGSGKIMRYSLTTRTLVTLADSIAALDGISVSGDSLYFGSRTTGNKTGALNAIAKSGGAIRTVRQRATGALAIDGSAIAYYSTDDSLLHYTLRNQDTSLFSVKLGAPAHRIQMDGSNIYALVSDSCSSSLLKVARSNTSTLILDDSIGCNPELLLDSAFVYVSDDINGGRVRAICNPTVTENCSAIIPAKLDFGTVSVQSMKTLPIENTSSVDYSIYATIRNNQFTVYPPSLSIPAHSTMSFRVYCHDSFSANVEDVIDFSINGEQPYASTRLVASHEMSVANERAEHAKMEYRNGTLICSELSGNYHLTRYDLLGRVLEQWDGVSNGEPQFIYLSDKQQFSVLRLQHGRANETIKIFR
jgi:hypothetical protein